MSFNWNNFYKKINHLKQDEDRRNKLFSDLNDLTGGTLSQVLDPITVLDDLALMEEKELETFLTAFPYAFQGTIDRIIVNDIDIYEDDDDLHVVNDLRKRWLNYVNRKNK